MQKLRRQSRRMFFRSRLAPRHCPISLLLVRSVVRVTFVKHQTTYWLRNITDCCAVSFTVEMFCFELEMIFFLRNLFGFPEQSGLVRGMICLLAAPSVQMVVCTGSSA